jgi:hypothetical protein
MPVNKMTTEEHSLPNINYSGLCNCRQNAFRQNAFRQNVSIQNVFLPSPAIGSKAAVKLKISDKVFFVFLIR